MSNRFNALKADAEWQKVWDERRTFAADDLSVEVTADTALALGLTSLLAAPPLRSLLFTRPDAAALRRCGLAQEGDPREAAHRLADPSFALLARSLRVASRSTPEQAREYDAELRHLR